jgi:steroid delta-isomerase-like uncharacterized protein
MTTKMTPLEVADRLTDAVNRHDGKAFASYYTADSSVIDPVYPEPLRGRAAIEKDVRDFITTFPDLSFERSYVHADGDLVIWEGILRGTHRGPLALPSGLVPATGRQMQSRICGFATVDDAGQITSERRYYDVAGLLDQLGLMQ